jgi:hypothetical protein
MNLPRRTHNDDYPSWMRTNCGRLQNFKPEVAAAWAPEEIEALMNIWSAVHGH